jgi:hypothetical protein
VITTTPAPTEAPRAPRAPHQHFRADRQHRYERAGVMLDSDQYGDELERNPVVREYTRRGGDDDDDHRRVRRFEEESDDRDGGNEWRDYGREYDRHHARNDGRRGRHSSHDDDDDGDRHARDWRRDYERHHERADADVRAALRYNYRQERRDEREQRSDDVVAVGAVDPNVHLAVGYVGGGHHRSRHHSRHHDDSDSYSNSRQHRERDHEAKVLTHISGRQVLVERANGRVAFIDGSEESK